MIAIGSVLLAACLTDPLPQAKPQQPLVFAAQVENVYVDAFVSRRGEPVEGLTAENFELKDNGVVQSLELASTDALPLLAVLVFDTSNSLLGERIAALRAAGRAFLKTLRPMDEATLIAFADDIQWVVRPTTDKELVGRAIDGLETAGATSVIDALYAAMTLPETKARTLIVLFTDGEDNLSFLDWKQVQKVAERSNALIHVIGLLPAIQASVEGAEGLEISSTELIHTYVFRTIAEATGGRYWEAQAPDRIEAAFTAIARMMGQRYVLRYEPQGVRREGWHKIELRLRGRKGDVHARRGYWLAERDSP